MTRFEHYILQEIIPSLIGAIVVMILMFLLAALQEVIAPLLAKGAHPLLVAQLLALNVPWALSQALPLSLMFATLLGLSRLSSDSEIKAAFAGGLSMRVLMRPVLLLGLLVTALSFAFGEGITPRTRETEAQVRRQIVFDNPRVVGLGEKDVDGKPLVLTDALGRQMSVETIEPDGLMRNLRIISTTQNFPKELMTAQEGRLQGNQLSLFHGQRITFQDGRPITTISFDQATLPLQDVEAKFDESTKGDPIKLSISVLHKRIQDHNESRDWVAFHRKFAEPLAALALSFFVVSLAIFSFRRSLQLGFTGAIILAFFYYATWSVFKVMGENGALPPLIAAYSPDSLAIVAGIILLVLAKRN